eukprot:CAMPEP_0172486784 /NCGR_PEP_ID=MMETSP1066-20121228/15514_1 /TAXON_ID=671091 /ORGANISM="Coscinodiscus wailesii, Strain CCMP2513" /LENGTH=375 /DNA_ID=CAMNT_0013252957 /DNA_START=131 /DNA_END=1258 /DNA_ORIENTATION=+
MAAPGFTSTPNSSILVTGSSGLVGARLVEMLLERGAKKVVCFDVTPPDDILRERFRVASKGDDTRLTIYEGLQDGNLVNTDAVNRACEGIDIVYHIAALVGPFHDRSKVFAVNYQGTLNVIAACRSHKISKLIFSSSPSTRFHGNDVTGQREDELTFPKTYLAAYAESKAAAERAVTDACCPELLTVSVAPHQVYGPYDSLFLPNLLETAGNGRLRVFGRGENKISVCYVDNYCHGLMCGADALAPESAVLGKFYIVTDGEPVYFWKMINGAAMEMGFTDLFSKFHLPVWFLMVLAHCADVVGVLIGKKFKLNPFNVKMLIIHRYFSIENAKRDLKYEPVLPYKDAWKSTVEWFKKNWLPGYLERKKTGQQKKLV